MSIQSFFRAGRFSSPPEVSLARGISPLFVTSLHLLNISAPQEKESRMGIYINLG